MVHVKFLPARFGDCIWIEYGSPARPRRILIDGGTKGTRKAVGEVVRRLGSDATLDLLVVTHIDRDHIEGILDFLEQPAPGLSVSDLWFNSWNHLPGNADEMFGAVQGERLTSRILTLRWPWNRQFHGRAVAVGARGDLPVCPLPDGAKLTLLSPDAAKLAALRPKWDDEVRDANLDPGFGLKPNDEETSEEEEVESFGADESLDVAALAAAPFVEDSSAANGSSIAFLLECEGHAFLFAADAHPSLLLDSLNRISPHDPVRLDLFKVSHHGSRFNTSRELLRKISCPRYVFSTNGSIHHHPDREAVARVILDGGPDVELVFNYRTPINAVWDSPNLQMLHGYRVRYPACTDSGIEVEFDVVEAHS